MNMTTTILRTYQREAVDSTLDYLRDNPEGHPIIAMPTGTGKSLVIAGLAKELAHRDGGKVLKLTHVKELIHQNEARLLDYWPDAPVGVVSAGLGRYEIDRPIVFGGIGSVIGRMDQLGKVGTIIVDESHRIPINRDSQYRQLIDYLSEVNPGLQVVGLTATPYRAGQGWLTEGKGRLFTGIAFDNTQENDFKALVRDGYLSPITANRTMLRVADTEAVKVTAGEYNQSQLQDAVNVPEVTKEILADALERGRGRQHWLVFCAGINHTEAVTAALTDEFNQLATCVHSKLSSEDRGARIDDFKSGRVRIMVNSDVLTTGFDAPNVDHIVTLRPTKSASLHVQMLGRGTRPSPGKVNCLVSDYARNIETLGLIHKPNIPNDDKGVTTGLPRQPRCPACDEYVDRGADLCPACGYDIAAHRRKRAGARLERIVENIREREREAEAQRQRAEEQAEDNTQVYEVRHYRIDWHQKKGKPPVLRVTYTVRDHLNVYNKGNGTRTFNDWLPLESESWFARKKAVEWWRLFSNAGHKDKETGKRVGINVPWTVRDALRRGSKELKDAKEIRVDLSGKYPQVTGRRVEPARSKAKDTRKASSFGFSAA